MLPRLKRRYRTGSFYSSIRGTCKMGGAARWGLLVSFGTLSSTTYTSPKGFNLRKVLGDDDSDTPADLSLWDYRVISSGGVTALRVGFPERTSVDRQS